MEGVGEFPAALIQERDQFLFKRVDIFFTALGDGFSSVGVMSDID